MIFNNITNFITINTTFAKATEINTRIKKKKKILI